MLVNPRTIPIPTICPKHIAATNVGMLTGSTGILGPTKGFSILVLSKRITKQLTPIIIAVAGLHAGVAGTVA
jgi:hypothetical protein